MFGRHAESRHALQELETRFAVDAAYQIGAIYAAYGEVDHALQWLERAREQRDSGLSSMKYEPVFRPLHADPRWGDLLEKIGLGR